VNSVLVVIAVLYGIDTSLVDKLGSVKAACYAADPTTRFPEEETLEDE